MKKHKVIFSVVGAVIVLFLAVAAAGWVMIDSLAKQAVEQGGQYALGVPTKVDSISLSLVGGSMKMDTLNVGNPDGFASSHLMQTGQFHLAVNPGSLFSDTVVVPTFELDGLDMNIESKGLGKNNISVVLDHVKNLGGPEQPAQQPQQARQEDSGKKVRVDKVVIRDVVAHVLLPVPGAKPLTVKVPAIELSNVSSDKGVSVQDLIGRLMPAILASVLESGKGIIPSDLLANLNGDLANTVNALGGQAAQLVQQGVGQASAQVQQALNQVQQVVPQQAGQVVEKVSGRAQGALGQVQQATAKLIPNAPGTQPSEKKDVGKALEGLFKK